MSWNEVVGEHIVSFRKVGEYVNRLGTKPVLRRDPRCSKIREALKKVSGGTVVNAVVEVTSKANTFMGQCMTPCSRRRGVRVEGATLGAWMVTLRDV